MEAELFLELVELLFIAGLSPISAVAVEDQMPAGFPYSTKARVLDGSKAGTEPVSSKAVVYQSGA